MQHDRRSYDADLAVVQERLDRLTEEVEKMARSMDGLAEAWTTAKGTARIVRWLAGLATAAAVLWQIIKPYIAMRL